MAVRSRQGLLLGVRLDPHPAGRGRGRADDRRHADGALPAPRGRHRARRGLRRHQRDHYARGRRQRALCVVPRAGSRAGPSLQRSPRHHLRQEGGGVGDRVRDRRGSRAVLRDAAARTTPNHRQHPARRFQRLVPDSRCDAVRRGRPVSAVPRPRHHGHVSDGRAGVLEGFSGTDWRRQGRGAWSINDSAISAGSTRQRHWPFRQLRVRRRRAGPREDCIHRAVAPGRLRRRPLLGRARRPIRVRWRPAEQHRHSRRNAQPRRDLRAD